MEDFSSLLMMCTIMFITTLALSLIPSVIRCNPKYIELVSIGGAGFLVGTALLCIIPEGVMVLVNVQQPLCPTSSLITSHHNHDHHHHRLLSLPQHPQLNRNLIEISADTDTESEEKKDTKIQPKKKKPKKKKRKQEKPHTEENETSEKKEKKKPDSLKKTSSHSHSPLSIQLESIISQMGLFTLLGFLSMLILERETDNLTSKKNGSKFQSTHGHDGTDDETIDLMYHSHSHGHGHLNIETTGKNTNVNPQSNILPMMIGLIVHSLIDGIALGAVSAENNSDGSEVSRSLSWVVLIALMGHKGPTAISVSSFLLRGNTSRKEVWKYMAMFAASSPFCAIVTYLILHGLFMNLMGWSAVGSHALGWCLLFSGGTFLQVVTMHILPEVKSWRGNGQFTRLDLGLLCVGAFLPMMIGQHRH